MPQGGSQDKKKENKIAKWARAAIFGAAVGSGYNAAQETNKGLKDFVENKKVELQFKESAIRNMQQQNRSDALKDAAFEMPAQYKKLPESQNIEDRRPAVPDISYVDRSQKGDKQK